MRIDLTVPQTQFSELDCKYPLFVAGYGTGKTYIAIINAWSDMRSYLGANIGIYSCTHDLLKLNLIPRTKQFLEDLGVTYTYNATDKVMVVPGAGSLIFRSMDNPDRIISYETFRSHVDELDLLPQDKSREAWNRIIARDRQKANGINKTHAYSTPEGFKFTYDRWSKNGGGGYQFVTAPTSSNAANLPDGYLDGMRETYTDQQLKAYLAGEWVNLASGAVYPEYDKDLNNTHVVARPRETLHIGVDFNVMFGAAVVHVIREGLPYAVGEVVDSRDTGATVTAIKENFPEHPVICYPDASGKSRTSQNASDSDLQVIKDAGFKINAPNSNPLIKDRVAAMNAMIYNALGKRRYRINVEQCPNYSLALEQQTYDKNGVPDKSSGIDHIVDAAGYFIHRKYAVEKRVAGIKTVGGF